MKEENLFNKRLKYKNNNNSNNNMILKKKLLFNSIINNHNKNSSFIKKNLKRKITLKNFLEKTDFFFNDINF